MNEMLLTGIFVLAAFAGIGSFYYTRSGTLFDREKERNHQQADYLEKLVPELNTSHLDFASRRWNFELEKRRLPESTIIHPVKEVRYGSNYQFHLKVNGKQPAKISSPLPNVTILNQPYLELPDYFCFDWTETFLDSGMEIAAHEELVVIESPYLTVRLEGLPNRKVDFAILYETEILVTRKTTGVHAITKIDLVPYKVVAGKSGGTEQSLTGTSAASSESARQRRALAE